MTSIAQIITELVHRGEIALAEELTEILHMSPELVTSQDEDKGDGGEEPPPADPAPMIPDEEGVSVRMDYAGEQHVIFMTVDKNVMYWNAAKKLWVDSEENATRYQTKEKAEQATKRATKDYEKKYEGKDEPKEPPPPATPEEPAKEPEKAPEKPSEPSEDKTEKKKPVPPQFQKGADKEAKAQLIQHLEAAGYTELAGAISGDLGQKK